VCGVSFNDAFDTSQVEIQEVVACQGVPFQVEVVAFENVDVDDTYQEVVVVAACPSLGQILVEEEMHVEAAVVAASAVVAVACTAFQVASQAGEASWAWDDAFLTVWEVAYLGGVQREQHRKGRVLDMEQVEVGEGAEQVWVWEEEQRQAWIL
jgi:hypothetical protein